MIRLPLLLLAAVLAAAPGAAPAAAQASDSARAALWLHRDCPGGLVRVTTGAGPRIQGRCGPIEAGRLVVREADVTHYVPFTALEGVWVRRRGTGHGAATGALIGGVAGGVWTGLVASGLCGGGPGCERDMMLLGLVGGAAGALTGTVLGAATGSRTRVWVRVYPWPR